MVGTEVNRHPTALCNLPRPTGGRRTVRCCRYVVQRGQQHPSTQEAFVAGKTIRELCLEKIILPEEQLNEALAPWRMTHPRP